jgi:hypothetical protein
MNRAFWNTNHWLAFVATSFQACLVFVALNSISSVIAADADEEAFWMSPEELRKRVDEAFEPPADCKPLHPKNRIWINRDEQFVVMDGYIVQRDVQLELFACPAGSKEHEAIVAVIARAQSVHAGLLAIGAKPGSPASFDPFKPASGTTIRVYALWLDADGKPKATLAQNWIRRIDTKKAMTWDWVFAGSQMYKDEEGKTHYLGDSGELISVSNFTTSTMDVAVRSDQANSALMFEGFADRIPPRNTPVRLVLSLSSDTPFGTDPSDPKDKDKDNKDKEPAFLTEEVPESVLKCLEPKKK